MFKDIANYCDELGVASVYFYAFSTENWKRPLEEVGAIMKLFAQYLIEGFDYKTAISALSSWATAPRWTPSCKR